MGSPLEFQSAQRELDGEPITFTLDGEEFECSAIIGAMPLLQLGAASKNEADSAAGMEALFAFLEQILIPADWTRFIQHCRQHRTDMETIMAIVKAVVPEIMGRPTKQQSDSPSSSQAPTAPSRVVSLSPGSNRELAG